MKKWFIVILLFLSGCNPALSGLTAQSDLNTVPNTFENPYAESKSPPDLPSETTPATNAYSAEAAPQKTTEIQASNLIFYAQKVIQTEGQKLGTACNLFLQRVLFLAGFKKANFLANDFDVYAKKYFKYYKSVDFVKDKNNSEKDRLRKHIWSYPERTAFIMQWSQTGGHGHLAFVERIDQSLVIYHASLGRKTPRKEQTSVDILLDGYNRRRLTVYSEMTPR